MEEHMDRGKSGIDPITIQTIRQCFEKQFSDVKFSQNVRPTFIFHDSIEKQSWHVIFNEEFLAGHPSIEELQLFVEHKVIAKVLKNPGKRIQISRFGDITVEDKYPS
jgi:hypothetical protein